MGFELTDMRNEIGDWPLAAMLAQAEWWRTGDGMPIRLTTMESSHRFHTLAFLRRRARSLRVHYWWMQFGETPDYPLLAEKRMIAEPPEAWLERQPLVVELARLVRMDDSVEGDVVAGELE